jgi:NAD(P)-dependent dehydrogenase (short-subunit alcohol dehydrogenase family)
MPDSNVAVVTGVGPGLGASVARRFARAGFQVALMARHEDKLAPVQRAIREAGGTALSVPCDATDPSAVAVAFSRVRDELGDPDLFVYNAGTFEPATITEIEPDAFERCWKANCMGAFLGAREVIPNMLERERGTILFTGATASLRGGARFINLAVGKFGLRALAQSMARELGPQGIHVAHVIIDGQIRTPRTTEMFPDREEHSFLDPDAIAETYYQLHAQDRTSWTHELDLRPSVEKF